MASLEKDVLHNMFGWSFKGVFRLVGDYLVRDVIGLDVVSCPWPATSYYINSSRLGMNGLHDIPTT